MLGSYRCILVAGKFGTSTAFDGKSHVYRCFHGGFSIVFGDFTPLSTRSDLVEVINHHQPLAANGTDSSRIVWGCSQEPSGKHHSWGPIILRHGVLEIS